MIRSRIRNRRSFAFLAIVAMLMMVGFALISAPQMVQAEDRTLGRSNLATSNLPTQSPHLLWPYNVVVAFNPEFCSGQHNGVVFYGIGNILISGGGVLSYGCLQAIGSPIVTVEPPYKIFYAGDFYGGNGQFDPAPELVRNFIHLPEDFSDQAQDACDRIPTFGAITTGRSTQTVIPPGNYSSITVTDTLTMLPGLYCLAGDFKVNSSAILTGKGVSIYMKGGDFIINGSPEVHLIAPSEGILPDPVWRDLLLYVAHNNPATITLGGNEQSNYRGIVYAPVGEIEVLSNPEYHTQFIGWNVRIGGTGDIYISVDFWPGMPKHISTMK